MRGRFLTALTLSSVFFLTIVPMGAAQSIAYATKSGTVFQDFNADGIHQESDEPTLSGFTLELWDVSGTPYPVATALTDENGEYSFENITDGATYAVCLLAYFYYTQTWPRATARRVPAREQLYACDDLGQPPTYLHPVGYQFTPSPGDVYADSDFGVYEGPLPEPQQAADCREGGWRSVVRADGAWFRNIGACVSYVVTRG